MQNEQITLNHLSKSETELVMAAYKKSGLSWERFILKCVRQSASWQNTLDDAIEWVR